MIDLALGDVLLLTAGCGFAMWLIFTAAKPTRFLP